MTSSRDLGTEIYQALRPQTDQPWNEHQQTIDRTHAALRSALELLCPGLQVKMTGYFNHSFIPDAVLRDADDEIVRHVFLRLGDGTDRLFADDITYAGSEGPVFICIGADDPDLAPEYDMAAVKYGDRCLVVPRPSLTALGAAPGSASQQMISYVTGFLDVRRALSAAAGDQQTLSELLPAGARDIQLRLA